MRHGDEQHDLDRELDELLEELRVVLPGVTVLTGSVRKLDAAGLVLRRPSRPQRRSIWRRILQRRTRMAHRGPVAAASRPSAVISSHPTSSARAT